MAELKHEIITITKETYLKRVEEIKEAARQEEREACALVCEFLDEELFQGKRYGSVGHQMQRAENKRYAEAIRKRGGEINTRHKKGYG